MWMRHVTHQVEKVDHIREWGVSIVCMRRVKHVWMRHATYQVEGTDLREKVVSSLVSHVTLHATYQLRRHATHQWRWQITCVNEGCWMCEWGMSRTCECDMPHMKWHMSKWGMSRIQIKYATYQVGVADQTSGERHATHRHMNAAGWGKKSELIVVDVVHEADRINAQVRHVTHVNTVCHTCATYVKRLHNASFFMIHPYVWRTAFIRVTCFYMHMRIWHCMTHSYLHDSLISACSGTIHMCM